MKAYLQVLLFIILINNSFSQKNNFIAEYKLIYKPIKFDSLTKKKSNNENVEFQKYFKSLIYNLKNAGNSLENISYKLEFNKQASSFTINPILESDISRGKLLRTMLGIKDETYFTNDESIINNKNSYGEDFLVDMPKLKWKIFNKKKKIGNYWCYKATTIVYRENSKKKFNKTVTAWFTPEISYNYGTKNYSGLPGLIVLLKENDNISLQLVKIQEKRYSILSKPKKGKKISEKEFKALSKKMYENRKN
ncbi:GLPGLI family protein [uncultured Polaribacter sp.]|uniref:GLPGLI family protein n=1 Tax=uncultured Polaribacter sp. TaxID=174711 RepID=UPI00260C48F3|nr:GLPGLI family protein [uncultured Polaribacter sp.]